MFFVGAGIITFVGATVQLVIKKQTSKSIGGYVFALILLGVWLGEVLVWFWPVVLAVVGVL